MADRRLAKYGVEYVLSFELYEVDGVDLRVDAADAGSDCTIRKDQGADATATNDFVDEGMSYSLTVSATEMEAKEVTVHIIDSATKVWLDKVIVIETYGHASALHAMDFDDSVRGGLTALPNAAAGSAGGLPDDTDSNGAVRVVDGTGAREINTNSGAIALVDLVTTTTTNSDMVAEAPTASAVVNEWETQSQADPTGFHVNVLEVGGTSQTANDNGLDINTLITQIGTGGDGLTALNDVSTAEVLTQVNAALDTAISELSAATQPTATPTLRTGLMLLYMALRNRIDIDTGTATKEVFNDAGSLVTSKALTDLSGVYSEAQMT